MKIEVKDLIKCYGTQKAIDVKTLNVPVCQTLVLIGPSGGGKSTLLRLLAGLEVPDQGEISLNDHPIIYREIELREYRKRLGIVFQSWNLFPHLTALENIILPLYRVHGLSLEESRSRSMELLKRFELEKHAYKKPGMLSGGQVQRIALIRAVAIQPKMLCWMSPLRL